MTQVFVRSQQNFFDQSEAITLSTDLLPKLSVCAEELQCPLIMRTIMFISWIFRKNHATAFSSGSDNCTLGWLFVPLICFLSSNLLHFNLR